MDPCNYCDTDIPSTRLMDHYNVCPMNPTVRFMILVINSGDPKTIPPPILYGGPMLGGCSYYDPKDLDAYNDARVTGFSYNTYENMKLLKTYTAGITDDNRHDVFKDLQTELQSCNVCVMYNEKRDFNIVKSEAYRLNMVLDTWLFSVRDCAVNMGVLNYTNRDSIETLWKKLYDEQLPKSPMVEILWNCLIRLHRM